MGIRRPIWRYGLFQIPAILLAACLTAAGLAYLFRLGCPDFRVRLFFGLAWIALMWTLIMPIDYFLKFVLKLNMSLAGRIAILHAIFWTILTSIILTSTLPALNNLCIASEAYSLDWSQWRANIWNEMFFNSITDSVPIGSEADFSFVVSENEQIEEIQVSTPEPDLEAYVRSRIESLEGKKLLEFVPGTRRKEVLYEGSVSICKNNSPNCGEPADSSNYPDTEEYNE